MLEPKTTSIKALLGQFFSNIDEIIDEILLITKTSNVETDEVILREGQENDRLLMLLSGSVSVLKMGERIQSYTAPGTLLGEMSLITNSLCTATIVADTPTCLAVIEVSKVKTLPEIMQAKLQSSIYQMYSVVLTNKLTATSEKARLYEITNRELHRAQEQLAAASAERVSEIALSQLDFVKRLENLIQLQVEPLKKNPELGALAGALSDLAKEARGKQKQYVGEKVLVCEPDAGEQIHLRMALGAIGATNLIVPTVMEAKQALEASISQALPYDVICLGEGFIDLMPLLKQLKDPPKLVWITTQSLKERVAFLRKWPEISAIVVRDTRDPVFTMRNLSTTIRKLSSGDLFGLEKYLSWGTAIKDVLVAGSVERASAISEMQAYFGTVGVGRILSSRCSRIAEEMLMNAIYDAPTDLAGKPLYNHLSRDIPIRLGQSDQPKFRYACDGATVAISCEDRFGGLTHETVLAYLERCLGGEIGQTLEHKGGGGNGLFQSIQTASLYVFNLKPGARTEVIALFSTALQFEKLAPLPSYHFFS